MKRKYRIIGHRQFEAKLSVTLVVTFTSAVR